MTTTPDTPTDWWDRIYDALDDELAAPAPAVENAPPARPALPGGNRLPDWRKGETVDLDALTTPPADTPPDTSGPRPDTDLQEQQPEAGEQPEPAVPPMPTAPPTVPPLPAAEPAPEPDPGVGQQSITILLAEAQPDPRKRRRWAIATYNATAAGTGWLVGLGPAWHSAMTDHGASAGVGSGVGLGIGLIVLATPLTLWANHRNTAVRWLGRIPLATAVTALALYTPNSTF